MSLGIVTSEDFDKELAIASSHKPIPTKGRGNTPEVPAVIRKTIAEEAINGNGTGEEIAEAFGVSESSVAAYKHGATSTKTYHEPNQELLEANNKVKLAITDSARAKLRDAIDKITSDKLEAAKVRDLASVAKDMSQVVRNMEPQVPQTQIGNAQFIFHVPESRKESEFEVIDVNQ